MNLLTVFLILIGPFLVVAPPALLTWAEFAPRSGRPIKPRPVTRPKPARRVARTAQWGLA